MSADSDLAHQMIWATRGRSWGFRFLLKGGLPDPLREYEHSFQGAEEEPSTWRRATTGAVAVRFPDPLGRRDAAGRVIPHDFVAFGDLADEIDSVEEGLKHLWPLVADLYARVWDADGPPAEDDLGL